MCAGTTTTVELVGYRSGSGTTSTATTTFCGRPVPHHRADPQRRSLRSPCQRPVQSRRDEPRRDHGADAEPTIRARRRTARPATTRVRLLRTMLVTGVEEALTDWHRSARRWRNRRCARRTSPRRRPGRACPTRGDLPATSPHHFTFGAGAENSRRTRIRERDRPLAGRVRHGTASWAGHQAVAGHAGRHGLGRHPPDPIAQLGVRPQRAVGAGLTAGVLEDLLDSRVDLRPALHRVGARPVGRGSFHQD